MIERGLIKRSPNGNLVPTPWSDIERLSERSIKAVYHRAVQSPARSNSNLVKEMGSTPFGSAGPAMAGTTLSQQIDRAGVCRVRIGGHG
jgi:hypothetical protein